MKSSSGPLFYFLQLIFLAIPTALFLHGFFLTKRETGLHSHFSPIYDPYPPLYIISEEDFNDFNNSIWRTGKTESGHANIKEVYDSFQQWEKSLDSKCIEDHGQINGRDIVEFISCRVIELSQTPNKFLNIWSRSESASSISDLGITNKNIEYSVTSPIDQIIIIVIDALRFDFVKTEETSEEFYHLNQMSFLNQLLNEEVNNSRLFQFIADAPTATTQRLKALVSGTLPTFFEVSESFSSTQVSEDTILSQLWRMKLSRNNKFKSVIMGDDTWNSLFSDHIDRSYPFPSFDIQDLDSVDNGILNQIWNEVNQTDWSLLVGHFLGVDHVGHKHQVCHPEMSRKLRQYDEFIKQLVTELKSNSTRWMNTMLVVYGDHGQTDDGAHGGALPDETDSALFAFTPHLKFSNLEFLRNQLKELNEDLTEWDFDHHQNNSHHHRIPQIDIVPTLATLLGLPIPFSNLGSIIPDIIPSVHTDPSKQLRYLTSIHVMNAFQIRQYTIVYLEKTGKWIAGGTDKHWNNIVRLYGEIWELYWNNTGKHDNNQIPFIFELLKACRLYQSSVLEGARRQWTTFGTFSLGFGVFGTSMAVLFSAWTVSTFNSISILCPESVVLAIVCGGMFSDCFSMLESTVLRFTFISYLICRTIMAVFMDQSVGHPSFRNVILAIPFSKYSLFFLLLAILTRIGPMFDISEALPGATPNPIFWRSLFMARSVCCFWSFGISVILIIIFDKEKNPEKKLLPTMNFIQFFVIISWLCLSIALFLAFDNVTTFRTIILPRFILIFSVIKVFLILFLFMMKPAIFYFSPAIPCFIIGATVFYPTILLWTVDQFIPSILSIAILICSGIFSYYSRLDAPAIVCLFFLSGFVGFFNLGHRMTFNAIPISAGFLGLSGYHEVFSFVLVFFHTFIIFIWVLIVLVLVFCLLHSTYLKSLHLGLSIANFGFTLRMLASQISLIFLRRHLMVWNVFAPKFLYDLQLSFLVLLSSFLISVIFYKVGQLDKQKKP